MRIAIATDRDSVSAHFGCAPAFTIVDLEGGRVCSTLTIPNPGCQHAFWADLFRRNSVRHVIAGGMGDNALAVIQGYGLGVIVGVQGSIEDAIRRYVDGTLAAVPTAVARSGA